MIFGNKTLHTANEILDASIEGGQLKDTSGAVFIAQKEGRKTVAEAKIYFRKELIYAAEIINHEIPIGLRIASGGLVEHEELNRAIANSGSVSSPRIVDFLLQRQLISEKIVNSYVKEHFIEILGEILSWDNCVGEWHPNVTTKDFNMPYVALEKIRAVLATREKVRNDFAEAVKIFFKPEEIENLTFTSQVKNVKEYGTEVQAILGMSDGNNTVADISHRTGLAQYTIFQTIISLWKKEFITLQLGGISVPFSSLTPNTEAEEEARAAEEAAQEQRSVVIEEEVEQEPAPVEEVSAEEAPVEEPEAVEAPAEEENVEPYSEEEPEATAVETPVIFEEEDEEYISDENEDNIAPVEEPTVSNVDDSEDEGHFLIEDAPDTVEDNEITGNIDSEEVDADSSYNEEYFNNYEDGSEEETEESPQEETTEYDFGSYQEELPEGTDFDELDFTSETNSEGNESVLDNLKDIEETFDDSFEAESESVDSTPTEDVKEPVNVGRANSLVEQIRQIQNSMEEFKHNLIQAETERVQAEADYELAKTQLENAKEAVNSAREKEQSATNDYEEIKALVQSFKL